jgi:chloramphenicol 3-O-phosphotransferase
MKKYVMKMVALLLFTSVAISSCSIEYRERRRGDREHGGDRGRETRDRNYDEVHHN